MTPINGRAAIDKLTDRLVDYGLGETWRIVAGVFAFWLVVMALLGLGQ